MQALVVLSYSVIVREDEFSAELAEGVAYVAGNDDESRPVVIFHIKQDYQKLHSQKLFTRLLAFTLEVAIGTMTKNAEQFVLLFDASFYRLAVRGLCRRPPSFLSYIWNGVRPFVELSTAMTVVSSLDFEESIDFDDYVAYPRASSLRSEPAKIKTMAKPLQEGQNARRFRKLYADKEDMLVPDIYWDYTSAKVLTMEWVDGVKLSEKDAIEGQGLKILDLVNTGIQCSLRQLLEYGFPCRSTSWEPVNNTRGKAYFFLILG